MPESLGAVQRWMQGAIVSGTDHRRANRLVKPSWSLSPEERLRIYEGMYPLRMRDALAADYPGLLRGLGKRRFWRLVADYVAVHPSRSYTLCRLGDHLPEFLRRAPGQADRLFWADLARLELTITEVFDAFEKPRRSPARLSARTRVPVTSTLRLASFRFPVTRFLDALRGARRRPSLPEARRIHVAVFRRELAVRRIELTRPGYELLSLLSSGRPLGAALVEARKRFPRGLSEHAVARLFRQWTASGIILASATANRLAARRSAGCGPRSGP